jgi:Photosynthetic reaction centre cytochrome C subunit
MAATRSTVAAPVIAFVLCISTASIGAAQQPAPGEVPSAINQDSAADRTRMVKEILATIPGRDTLPAGVVFKHVTTSLKDVSAAKLLAIMDFGYGRSLGVSCAHCHVTSAWESEEKPQKQIAREMAQMDSVVIFQYLAHIQHLKSERPLVNCTTCHRGSVKPALDLH